MIIKPRSENLTFASSVSGSVKESNYFMLKYKSFFELEKFDAGYFTTLGSDDDREEYDANEEQHFYSTQIVNDEVRVPYFTS